ncbi:hypothetical protein Krac_5113 [Ktedonobacter racemifer DSM 44963]|uniref:Uncharacterized protein n=1 Tax=Ktedonobacter racemifer DSM 44963 TaxID=485913 RepID=D6TUM7_KTERA|nr:hypothetical protein Krac_5113 [Ktedonobacter racemifer DSM 44963]
MILLSASKHYAPNLVKRHIRDCGTIFDRVRVHWSIHAEMSYFVRLCMDYEDSNWFKPDGIWFKVAKRRFVVEQEHATECFPLELAAVALLSQVASQASELLCYFAP